MTLYLDVYFLVNFLMDLLILDLTKHFLKLSGGGRRLFLASAAASGLSCLAVLAGWQDAERRGICGILCAFLMARTAYGKAAAGEMLRRTAVLLIHGMVFAGGLSLIAARGMRAWMLTLWAVVIFVCVRMTGAAVQRHREDRKRYCAVRLEYRGRSVVVTALADTGNLLCEPYGHEPVHVATAQAVRQICDSVSRVIYIPYRSVGREEGVLPAIRIDRMTVEQEGKPALCYERPWIAVSPSPLSSGHSYEMLLHL